MSLFPFMSSGVSVPTPSLDCCDGQVCQAAGSPDCNTLRGCTDAGEQHRVQWSHTDCNNTYHHIAIHVSVDGGGYTEIVDTVACCPADPDSGCCEFIGGGCADDCNWMRNLFKSSDTGSCTTTYQYRVRVETDGTDTAIDTCTETGSGTGCDAGCTA